MRRKKCKNNEKITPVLLMHGFLLSANGWLDGGSDNLVYLLTDSCYDLWVGNIRGNTYGRKHLHLNPAKPDFWKFSADEKGIYDLPAIIDYILNETNSKRLNYIGYSEGGGRFFIMGSERPNHLDKIGTAIILAPAVRIYKQPPELCEIGFELVRKSESFLEMIGIKEIFATGSIIQILVDSICEIKSSIALSLCKSIFALIDSYNPGSITDETYMKMGKHFPCGASLRDFVRYGQIMKSGKFQKYDFGKEENMIKYKTETAPDFNLKDIKTPVVIIIGENDKIIDIENTKWLAKELPNVIEFVFVEDPLWNHFDMMYSKDIRTKLFPIINKHLIFYD